MSRTMPRAMRKAVARGVAFSQSEWDRWNDVRGIEPCRGCSWCRPINPSVVPHGFHINECARCGAPILLPLKDSFNSRMDVCPKCERILRLDEIEELKKTLGGGK